MALHNLFTEVGSDLDLVLKGGKPPCVKLQDPELDFSPQYVNSRLSNVSIFTLDLEEDNSSSSDSEEYQDLGEWATSLSKNLDKYISLINHEISCSSMNVSEGLVNTDSMPPNEIRPVDYNLVKSILGIIVNKNLFFLQPSRPAGCVNMHASTPLWGQEGDPLLESCTDFVDA